LQAFILVGIAGAAGAVSRYAVSLAAERSLGNHFAFGTLLVNVVGCVALGFLLEIERNSTLISHPMRLLFAVGFLGAFTTFSTFGYETFRYWQEGNSQLALANVSANLVLGLVGVWLGWAAARFLVPAA